MMVCRHTISISERLLTLLEDIAPLHERNQRVQLLLDLEATEVDHGEVRSAIPTVTLSLLTSRRREMIAM